MAAFLDYLVDSDYIKAHTKIKNKEEKGFIYIENETDKKYWKRFFGKKILESYEFNASSKDIESCSNKVPDRGKARYFDLLDKANRSAIFALDSDFDHLMSDRYDHCKHLVGNKYVFHTYGYNIESIYNSQLVIDSCMEDYSFSEENEYRFSDFLSEYSKIIYTPFVKYLHLTNLGVTVGAEDHFHSMIIPSEEQLESMFFNNDYLDFVNNIKGFDTFLTKEIEKYSSSSSLSEYVDKCTSYGLNESTTYQFINGHCLQDKVIDKLVGKVKNILLDEEIQQFKSCGAQGKQIGDRVNEIKNYFESEVRFSTLRKNSSKLVEDSLFKLSLSQLHGVFSV